MAPSFGPDADVKRGDGPDQHTLELIGRAQRGDEDARHQVVEANLALVAYLVRRLRPGPDDFDDLFQVGCIGLLKALKRFDPQFGVRFSTYAVPVILGEMRQHARTRHPVRVGRALQETARRAHAAADTLTQRLGRRPTLREIAHHLQRDVDDVALALAGLRPVASLAEPSGGTDGDDLTLEARLAAHRMADQETNRVDNIVLQEALGRLAPWERRLIGLRFFADKSQTEVARLLGVSQAHVSRSERRILARFRDALHG